VVSHDRVGIDDDDGIDVMLKGKQKKSQLQILQAKKIDHAREDESVDEPLACRFATCAYSDSQPSAHEAEAGQREHKEDNGELEPAHTQICPSTVAAVLVREGEVAVKNESVAVGREHGDV